MSNAFNLRTLRHGKIFDNATPVNLPTLFFVKLPPLNRYFEEWFARTE
jgi:hypothetical protein